VGGRRGEVGGREEGKREKFWDRKEAKKKNNNFGREDVLLVHPQNSFNGLIFNWCIGGYSFTPASKVKVAYEKGW